MHFEIVHILEVCGIVYRKRMYRMCERMGEKGDYFRESRESQNPVMAILIAMVAATFVTIVLLLLLTVLIYNTDISGTVSGILMVAIYVLGPFSGAFLLGKRMKKKRFLWGMLLGIIYFAVFVLISMLVAEPENVPGIREYIQVLLAVLPGGILGGMFS